MKSMLVFALSLGAVVPAFGDVAITAPVTGAAVGSPFILTATASACPTQAVVSMGYSIDSSPDTTIIWGAAINTQVAASLGPHTLHVKAWGNHGEPCVTDVPLTVVDTSAPAIPIGATVVNNIHALPNWQAVKDSGTGQGSATGSTSAAATPSLSGSARAFHTSYTNNAGERYYAAFGTDRTSTSFVYDTWVYLGDGADNIGNLEFEMNQVIPNGQTVIYAVRCNGVSGTWDYTQNGGPNPQQFADLWRPSTATCNPAAWTRGAWHHVQASYRRDDLGSVTYQSVWLDGVRQDINVTVPSSFALGWASVLLTNFQVDGSNPAGASTVYLDNLTIYRWVDAVASAQAVVPSTATANTSIQALANWRATNDVSVLNGLSAGSAAVVPTPSLSGSSRQFATSFSNYGGQRYSVSFDTDTQATNFLYDGWVYIPSSSNHIGNLELDMNQVMANGQTVIFGIQCDGATGTWDYTENAGTPAAYNDHWLHSPQPCNPRQWSPDTWHHVQFLYSRDDKGNVTYKSIWLEGVEQDLNVTVPSAFALGWKSVLLTNFQVDGDSVMGSATAYLDNLTIYRW